MPKVWNIRDPNCPKDAVYIGRAVPRYGLRGGKWRNPFRFPTESCPTREDAIEAYRLYITGGERKYLPFKELRGKDLACWCAPKPCHGDILLEVANEPDREG